ncbi:MAG TPA: polysaccharide biosynthesis protein [Candidatus Dormibacteraeota bacterium]|nr:polysaccharide biosynthesis protein [Candidatus Dormibacteraeota bacterium]
MAKKFSLSPAAFAGRRILITGAGGYIGGALAETLAAYAPALLVLLDSSEHNLNEIRMKMGDAVGALEVQFAGVLGDVCDDALLAELFERYRPEIIFHAAACKHVPLMEENPLAAMRTNAIGTWRLLRAAKRNGAAQLLLVSTDKAVHPASVMGATKRAAELVLERGAGDGIKLQTVRLGNVLGSPGSVAPLFARQIARGGPVTVTDPGAERYFLTLATTTEIILRASQLGPGTFIPKLAAAVRIVAFAERMIAEARKAGSRPIAVQFTGTRPGDKLREEFLNDAEISEITEDERLLRVRTAEIDLGAFDAAIGRLEEAVATRDLRTAMQNLREIVPEYRPSDVVMETVHESSVTKV